MDAQRKTKKVANVDLNSKCFAYVGDEQDTSTWHCCVHVLGDSAKTINAIKTSLGQFSETKGIPVHERELVWHTLRGAALALGIRVEERAKSEAPAKAAEPPPPPAAKVVEQNQVEKDPIVEAAIADADRRATALLRSLGYE